MPKEKKWISQAWSIGDKKQEEAILKMNKVNDYGPKEKAREYFDWRNRRNPAGEAIIRIAVDKDNPNQLAGIYAVIPVVLSCCGETIPSALSVGTLTDSRYRKQGIFTGLARQVYEECQTRGLHLVIGYPNPNSYYGFVNRLQFEGIHDVPLHLRIIHLSEILKRRVPFSALARTAEAIGRAANPFLQPRKPTRTGVVTLSHFDQTFDEFNEYLARCCPWMVRRDSVFLNWRYVDNPFDYRILAVRNRSGIDGYFVYRIIDHLGMRCGMVADFQFHNSDSGRKAARLLTQTAIYEMAERNCVISAAIAKSNDPGTKALRLERYYRCPDCLRSQPVPYIVRKNETGRAFPADPFDIRNWKVWMGDYDAA